MKGLVQRRHRRLGFIRRRVLALSEFAGKTLTTPEESAKCQGIRESECGSKRAKPEGRASEIDRKEWLFLAIEFGKAGNTKCRPRAVEMAARRAAP
jgi:hypothetical protein